MSEVKDFLKALNENPKAKELIKAAKEPANAEEAAALYADIAEKAGICVSKETIQEFLKNKESRQQEVTAKAEGLVKAALGEDDLESVAGGGQDERCSSTFDKGEWCWFSDSCSYVISYYDDIPDSTLPRDTNATVDLQAGEEFVMDDEDDSLV